MNRLANQTSPYLLQHAHNPVDWFPWGDEAFAAARTQNKPIFLSIGYSTCHWCHVMERESFENHDIAGLLNAHFISIKLDREERPDIDHIYMAAVQATTGRGGWPMSVWLTPDRKPFYCGTYFPPEHFRALLQRIHEIWQTNPTGIHEQANEITTHISHGRGEPPSELNRRLACSPSSSNDDTGETPVQLGVSKHALSLALDQFHSTYDPIDGGFGAAPKFPRPVALNFLLRTPGRDMALFTLNKMATGGLFDNLGGGFHRYSVDSRWHVSHFEKMLYDQAQLIIAYSDAYRITGDPFFADIAHRCCEYILRDMASPDGAFYSAEDADSEGVEGKFYVWNKSEIDSALNSPAFCDAYHVTDDGNWEHGLNILHGTGCPDERKTLLAIRNQRIRPHRDEKILTSWNALMISALCKAGVAGAVPAARYLLNHRWRDGQLWRTDTIPGLLDDYANFATALLDLYETTLDLQWLTHTTGIADKMLALFQDTDAGGFYMSPDASLIARMKDDYDGAEPAGNSTAALLLLRLAGTTGNDSYRQAALRTLNTFAAQLNQLPHAVPLLLCALDFALTGPVEITFRGKNPGALLRVVHETYLPNRVLRFVEADSPSTAQVCVHNTCQLPVSDPSELRKLLEKLGP
jgi:uncharacterized protein YyaL (SSP411 family)